MAALPLMDDFKQIDHTNIDRRHAKILLGAISCMYDDTQKAMGLTPSVLREMSKDFAGSCRPLSEELYLNLLTLKKVSFNLFYSEDKYESKSGWTDYGNEDWYHTGFQVLSNPFRIIEVQFNQKTCMMFPDDPEIRKHINNREIAPLDAFRRYGLDLFKHIADLEDWNVIISSF